MANRAAIALRLVSEPECSAKPAAADKLAPTAAGKPNEVERSIGQAVASAATALCYALQEHQNGGLAPATKLAGGERIAALFRLQQTHAGEIAFEVVAREQGRCVLRGYLDADGFYQRHSLGAGDEIINVAIDGVLEIVARVTAFERAMAN